MYMCVCTLEHISEVELLLLPLEIKRSGLGIYFQFLLIASTKGTVRVPIRSVFLSWTSIITVAKTPRSA